MRHAPSPFRLLPFRLLTTALVCLLALGFLAPAANAATARSLSIAASTTGAVVKGGVTFSGTLTHSPKGSKVTVQRKSGTKWVAARSTTTRNATGAWSVRVTLPATTGSYAFRAVAAKKGSLKAATSRVVKVSALRKATATLKVNPTTVTAGNNATFTGTVRPFVKNTVVTVQRLSGTKWVAVTTAALDAKGNFSRSAPVLNSGLVRVSVPRAGPNAPTTSAAVSITTNPAIATTTLPHATIGSSYSFTLTDKSHVPGTWTTSQLPDGLSLAPGTGVISGVPAQTAVTKQVTIGFTEVTGRVAAPKTLPLTVDAPVAPSITTSSLPDGRVGVAYSQQLAATGGPGTWSTTSTLPSGLTLSAAGLISGTPAAVGANPVTTPIAVKFTNTATNLSDTKSLSLTVKPPPAPVILTTSLPDAKIVTAYSAQLHVSGGVAGTWSATGLTGTGLSINTGTGVISGTAPLIPQTITLTVGFTETSTGAAAAAKHLTIKVANADPNPVLVDAGGQTACRIDTDQTMDCWGAQDAGQLGNNATPGDQSGVLKPTAVAGTGWTQVSESGGSLPGHSFGCGLSGAVAYCWGDDSSGQLGDGNNGVSRSVKGPVNGGAVWGSVSAGHQHTCATTLTGALYCWGDASSGELGLGSSVITDQTTPQRVGTDSDWVQVSAGYNATCAIKGTGTLWCWGFGFRGQLGNGGTGDVSTPTQVGSATDWAQVSNGSGYTCAVRTTGTLWCWGPASDGQLGNNDTVNNPGVNDVLTPLQIGTGTTWASVSAGESHTCATTTDGQVWCWGRNANGQVGNNTQAVQPVPVRIGTGSDWESVSAGGDHTCGVRATTVYCWGSNVKGQLGINAGFGATPYSLVPVAVVG